MIAACQVGERTIETTVDKAKAGLKCPHCATGFVPEQVDVKMEAEAFTPQPNLTETERMRGTAHTVILLAALCLIVALLCVFFGWMNAVGEGKDTGGSYEFAAGAGGTEWAGLNGALKARSGPLNGGVNGRRIWSEITEARAARRHRNGQKSLHTGYPCPCG